MPDFVGVISFTQLFNPQLIKRQALIFQRLAVPGCNVLGKTELLREVAEDYEWLLEQGIIFDPGAPDKTLWQTVLSRYADDPVMKQLLQWEHENKDTKQISQVLDALGIEPDTQSAHMYQTFMNVHWHSEFTLRPVCTLLREYKDMDAHPLFSVRPTYLSSVPAGKNDVVEIVLNALPVPDDSVSWEQVLEYRSDPDSTGKFLGLRNWMNEVVHAKLSSSEVQDKLEWLLHQYQTHLELHRMKTVTNVFETVVVTAADLLENMAKLKLGKAAQGLFSLRHRKIALMEAELNAPGNEVAFITKARKSFTH